MQQSTQKKVKEISTNKLTPSAIQQEKQLLSKQISDKEAISPFIRKQSNEVAYELDSPKKRRNPTFITQKKVSEVQEAHAELNKYIDILDSKVTNLIEKHQAQFMLAYRNHIKKVRQQMDQIRNKALNNANSTVSQTQKIETLEKQLTIFRQESLKLFQKVNDKQRTIYNLQTKINQLEAQKNHYQKSIKILTRRNKQLQGMKFEQQINENSSFEPFVNQKQFKVSRPQNQLLINENNNASNNIDFENIGSKSRPYTTAINSKGASIRSRNQSIQLRPSKFNDLSEQIQRIFAKVDEQLKQKLPMKQIQYIKQSIADILKSNQRLFLKQPIVTMDKTLTNKSNTRHSLYSKNSKSFFESKMQAKKNELQQYFYKSIEAVRKQITRRRGLKSLNFYNQYAALSLNQFKKVDFFRLLQLLLSHDRIISAVHNTIFQQTRNMK